MTANVNTLRPATPDHLDHENVGVKSKPKRAQFDFSPETWDILEQLKISTGARSNAEVIRRSIALYSWFQQEVKPDYTIEVKDKKGNLIYRMLGKFFSF